MIIKTKKQILYLLLGLLVALSFYLILEKIIHKPTIQLPEEKEAPSEEREFVYFQIPTGKIIEEVALNEKAHRKFRDILEKVEKTKEKSEILKDLSQELKELTDACLCGKSSCQGLSSEQVCCCQAAGCPQMNTCSKTKAGASLVEGSGCDLATACPERDCDLEAISNKITEIEKTMTDLKDQQKEIFTAQLSLLSDYLKLKKVKMMIGLSQEAIDYENFFRKKDLIEETYKQKLKVTTFSTWPEPTIKMDGTMVFDPSSIYFDKEEDKNKEVIKESSSLEPFLIITNKCPGDLEKIMIENAQEVFSQLNFEGLIPLPSKMDNFLQEAYEESIPWMADKISQRLAETLGKENATIIKEEVLSILAETDLFPFEISSRLSESLAGLLPNNLRSTLSSSLGETLPGDLIDLVYTNLLDKPFDTQLIKPTLSHFLPDKMTSALSSSLKEILTPTLERFLSENIPQNLGFVSSDIEKISDEIKEAQNLPLILREVSEESSKIISRRLAEKLAEDMSKKISDLNSEELSKKAGEDLEEIITPLTLKMFEQGLLLNSLKNSEDKEELKILYPQICQLTIPGLEGTDKGDKLFEACWEVKTIYDILPYQIKASQEMIKLIQDPEKGCDLNRCQAQCVDASCYAKDFYPKEGCQPDCIGHCSEYQTSYPSGPLPCKSNYLDFYNDNGLFRVCPDIYLANELIEKYHLQIEKAEKKIQDILRKENDKKTVELKEKVKRIKEKSEILKDLSGEFKIITDQCQCSKKSLCQALSCGCSAKGCSLLSQCSQEDVQKIRKKIEEIEEAIEELYYSTKK